MSTRAVAAIRPVPLSSQARVPSDPVRQRRLYAYQELRTEFINTAPFYGECSPNPSSCLRLSWPDVAAVAGQDLVLAEETAAEAHGCDGSAVLEEQDRERIAPCRGRDEDLRLARADVHEYLIAERQVVDDRSRQTCFPRAILCSILEPDSCRVLVCNPGGSQLPR
jgi:hypothetical protein